MKKVIYVVWLAIAIGLGFVAAVLNSKLLVLPFVLGGAGVAVVVIILALFIFAVYKIWAGRGIWFDK